MTIKKKFLLASVLFCGALIAVFMFLASREAYSIMFAESRAKAEMMLFSMKAVRKQVSAEIRPAATDLVNSEDFITPLQSTSYTANSVWNRLDDSLTKGMYFKTSSVKPRNPSNQATSVEAGIIKDLDELYAKGLEPRWEGIKTIEGTDFFIMAIGEVNKPSCMRCHSTPDNAPQGILDHYPPSKDQGYGRLVNRIESAEIISIPISFIKGEIADVQLWIIAVGIFSLVILLAGGTFGIRMVFKPIQRLTDVADEIATGDLQTASLELEQLESERKANATDEVSQLVRTFTVMVNDLSSLIAQVQRSGMQVTTSATQIAAQAREIENTVTEQIESTRQTSSASVSIADTAEQLVETMDDVGQVADETAHLAGEGRQGFQEMEAVMRQLEDATGSISSKLSVITEKTNNINSVVTTISKVAEQTNLLSFNASIEAEKAGEYGLGFSVVAREIRRLADQTAVSTADIENIVREMHSAVSAGVMEMDKFTQQVKIAAREIVDNGGRLEDIITKVRHLSPEFESVNLGMRAQSDRASRISETMNILMHTATKTSESLQEFKEATGQLNLTVSALQGEVAKFKV